jgi:serine protease
MPIRVLGVGGGTDYDLAQGIRYAAALDNDSGTYPTQRADIINLSLGSPAYSTTVANAVQAARTEGVIVVAAAGNEDTDLPFYPASYNGVVSVSAVETRKERAPYSNFGAYVDVAAPGGDMRYDRNGDGYLDGVLSTRATDTNGTPTPVFSFRQGTSMAAPHVAGVAALMRAVYPELTPDDFDALLASGLITEDLGEAGRDDVYGHGLIDALAAVEQARALGSAGELPPLLTVSPTALDFRDDGSNLDFIVANAGAGTLSVSKIDESAPWLSIQSTDVDASGLGTYTATVDRTGLPDAVYRATITVNGSNNASVAISVVMYVGSDVSTGDVGHLYVLLLDPGTGEILDSVISNGTGGVYDYTFSGLVPGSYRVTAGTDSDNDLLVCDPGEACGGYPTLGLLSDIRVETSDVTGIDFSVDFLSTLPAATALSDGTLNEWRIPPQ